MDSLTQIVLGGAVGEAVLGKKVGNKAILWGAIAGTIPDLDTFVGNFLGTVDRLEIHRGFSHSIVFAILIAPILAYLVQRIYQKKKEANWWEWTQLFFWAVFTHPLLDAFTTWGTQLFWPLDNRLAFQSIFVIDPLYTVPFMISLAAVMAYKRSSGKRRKWNRFGLFISSFYLLLSLGVKGFANHNFSTYLQENQINYQNFDSRPAPFSIILWIFNLETEDEFLISSYSLFDEQEDFEFKHFPKNHHLLNPYRNHHEVEKLIRLTKGKYIVEKTPEGVFLHDLRFGLINNFKPEAGKFVFTYVIEKKGRELKISQKQNSFENKEELLESLWTRMMGRV